MFLDKDVRTFLGSWGIINFLFWGQGLHDFLSKYLALFFGRKLCRLDCYFSVQFFGVTKYLDQCYPCY